ncbi:hypothetical protein FHR83_002310 [Actinoplanes campanulatus]|uniref:Uncharacterized protein n=1 Tax=Actinoplanes campanulatus TaxID=113559 RepID=A0A7W5FDU2_9ACTN|nr:hypothetical protein [Actinoplanes campanulatus]MBB3094647.1 hypothetical protein [Actinoplanes campanulatus]GGN06551.1 hypothetical protein GCM10010109_14350 [Actinoplanes campanulatus]GID35943.1 hypothetical protein Aca09nite_24490 [Actinoplanes campanulatus]
MKAALNDVRDAMIAGRLDHRMIVDHDPANEIQWEFPRSENLRKADKGMWTGDTLSYMAWMDCAASRKGLLRPGAATSAPTPAGTEDPEDILRADHPLDITGTC